MSYEVEFSIQAKRFLKNLDKELALRILKKFEEIKIDPFRYLEHYEGDYYKIRIGPYRALVDIDKEKHIIFIQVLDKRGRIYK